MPVRLSVEAKNALSLAKLEAKRYNLVYIGTELVLLALVEERGSISQQVFEDYGIDPRRLRQEVESSVLMGEQPLRPGQVIRAAPLVRRVVELAQEESERLRSEEVKNVHLLLALLRERNGVAAEVIDNLELDRTELREKLLQKLRAAAAPVEPVALKVKDQVEPVPEEAVPTFEEVDSPVEVLNSAIQPAFKPEDSESSDSFVTATALVLKGLCERYAAMKAEGRSETELLRFIKSVLKGKVESLLTK